MSRPRTNNEEAAAAIRFDRSAKTFADKAAAVSTEEEAQVFIDFQSGVAQRMSDSYAKATSVDQRELPERVAGVAIEGLCRFADRVEAEGWTANWPKITT